MTDLATQAAGTAGFNETALRNTLQAVALQAVALRARATEEDISQAISDGWDLGVQHVTQDGIFTQEEDRIRTFRERLVIGDLRGVVTGSAVLNRASAERISAQAGRAALAGGDGGAALQEVDNALRRAMMSTTHRRQLLIRAWEEAAEGAIEDGIESSTYAKQVVRTLL